MALVAIASLSWLGVVGGWMAQVHRPEVEDNGEALLSYWQRGLKMAPKPAISYDWYRSFIELLVNFRGPHLVFKDHHLRRVGDCHRADSRRVYRAGSFLRWINELELHHGRLGFHQWNVVRYSHVDCLSLEKCRLDRPRSLAVADARHSLEARSIVSPKPG